MPLGEISKDDSVYEAGQRCLDSILNHFVHRPKATGIQEHKYRPTDVIITTFPKAGTTLTQQMAYQVVSLSGGGPSFDPTGKEFADLAIVSPWIDYIPVIGIPPCETSPRVLKTHAPVTAFEGHKCRHVVVVRNPESHPGSWLDFLFDSMVPNAESVSKEVREATFHASAEHNLLTPITDEGLGKWHYFIKNSVFPLQENVLVLFYEDIVADMEVAVRSLASFMGCKLEPEKVKEVVRRCDRNLMVRDPRFFCRIESMRFGTVCDLPKAKPAERQGFKKFRMTEDAVKRLEDMNMKAFGVRTYKEFRDMIRKQQSSAFNY